MSAVIPILFALQQTEPLGILLREIKKEKDPLRKRFMIEEAYHYAKPSFWLMLRDYSDWKELKEMYRSQNGKV